MTCTFISLLTQPFPVCLSTPSLLHLALWRNGSFTRRSSDSSADKSQQIIPANMPFHSAGETRRNGGEKAGTRWEGGGNEEEVC